MFSDEELNRFYRYCMALTGNEENAFDLLQDSLEKFVRHGSYGVENKGGYFFRMIRNQFIDDWRKKRTRQIEAVYDEENVIQIDSQSLEDIVIDREQAIRMMDTLSVQDRELLFLWAIEGFTVQEIADHQEIPKGTLLARIHRFKIRIRETFGVEGKKVSHS